MQLLQSTRDSNAIDIDKIKEKATYIAKSMSRIPSEEEAVKIKKVVDESERLVVTYIGTYLPKIACFQFYYILRTIGFKISIATPEEVAYYIAPYTGVWSGQISTLIFADKPSSMIIRVTDSVKLSGNKVALISATSLPPLIASKVEDVRLVTLDNNLQLPVFATIAAATIALKPSTSNGVSNRLKRVIEEAKTIGEVAAEVVEKYSTKIVRVLRQVETVIIAYSPTLYPAVELISEMNLKNYRRNLVLVPLSQATQLVEENWIETSSQLLLVHTGVEDDIVREVKFKASMHNISVEQIRINTDPLTAQLYFTIAVLALTGVR